jgi:hypothetical protein
MGKSTINGNQVSNFSFFLDISSKFQKVTSHDWDGDEKSWGLPGLPHSRACYPTISAGLPQLCLLLYLSLSIYPPETLVYELYTSLPVINHMNPNLSCLNFDCHWNYVNPNQKETNFRGPSTCHIHTHIYIHTAVCNIEGHTHTYIYIL